MSTLQPWISDLRTAVKLGLQGMFKEPPMTAVEWADKHFYMSAESSYNEGRWKTAPFQVAILNAMGNDLIRVVNFVKSARIGYTKLLLANIGYKIQHKRRNVMMWSPTDPDAEDISKSHVNGLIRDVPVMLELAPWFGRKHSDNTLDNKVFANRRNLWIRGGKASRNYREKSPTRLSTTSCRSSTPTSRAKARRHSWVTSAWTVRSTRNLSGDRRLGSLALARSPRRRKSLRTGCACILLARIVGGSST